MSRKLVLTDEAARHPFRRMLPPAPRVAARGGDHDWRLFGLSFAAFFTCFYTLIF